MPRRRRRRIRRRIRKAFRRRSKPKLPLEMAGILIAIPFTPAKSEWQSPAMDIQQQNWEGLGNNLKSGLIGLNPDGSFDPFAALNPFNFEDARYSKMLIWSGIFSRVRKKFVRIPFNRIPVIGNMIS